MWFLIAAAVAVISYLLSKNSPESHHAAIDHYLQHYGCRLLTCEDTDELFDFTDPREFNGVFDKPTYFKAITFENAAGEKQACLAAVLKEHAQGKVAAALLVRTSIDIDSLLSQTQLEHGERRILAALKAYGYSFHQLRPTRQQFDYKQGFYIDEGTGVHIFTAVKILYKEVLCSDPKGLLVKVLVAFVLPLDPDGNTVGLYYLFANTNLQTHTITAPATGA